MPPPTNQLLTLASHSVEQHPLRMPHLLAPLIDPLPHFRVLPAPFPRHEPFDRMLEVIPPGNYHEHLAPVPQLLRLTPLRAATPRLLELPPARDGAVAEMCEVVLRVGEGFREGSEV